MPSWDAGQYLKFADERTQPCRDLAARVHLSGQEGGKRARIIDLGSGPGNSTAVLAARWPKAEITGLDNSAEMIAAARRDYPGRQWIQEGIDQWAFASDDRYNLVFSNAAMHWVPDHARVYPRLLERVEPGGALAVQVPGNFDMPAFHVLSEMVGAATARAQELPFYYDLLAGRAARLEMWRTEYLHMLDGVDGIVEWYKGSGLRPALDALPDDAARRQFLERYRERLAPLYPPQPNGKILFAFRRLFLIAYL